MAGISKDQTPSREIPKRKRHHDDTFISTCSEEGGKLFKGAPEASPSSPNLKNCPEYLHHFFQHPETNDGKPAAIFDNGKGIVERISYKELDFSANLLKEKLGKEPFINSGFIGVRCDLGILYSTIILGILRSGKGFFNIDKENWIEAVADAASHLNLKYFICDPSWEPSLENQTCTLEKVADVSGVENFGLDMYEIFPKTPTTAPSKVNTNSTMNPKFAYAIQTSGTTGKKKTVLVPHSCICPNIYDFIHFRWGLTSQDVVFGCAPPTFDPHIVELFTALAVGGTILYTTSSVKHSSHLLTSILMHHRVTVLQITPSLFRKVYTSFSNWSEHLSLRIVAFGGEKCPNKSELGVMRDSISTSSNLVFQNIYGITEVSCWASVCNIDLATDDPITVGEGIMDTDIGVDGTTGEIFLISSTRYCVIIDSKQNVINPEVVNSISANSVFKYKTGDMGRVVRKGIIFEGRMDRVVKRNGMKVPLFRIEEMALATGLVCYAECVLYNSKIALLVQLKPEFRHVENCSQIGSNNVLLPSLSKVLDIPLFMYPDFTVALNIIPLNSNGKLDCNNVINSLMKVKQDTNTESVPFLVSKDQVIKTLDPIWRSCTWPGIRSIDMLLGESFFEVGGDSISAARFVESAFLSLKLFGSDTHGTYEQNLRQKLFESNFESVVNLVCNILSRKNCLSTNFSNFSNDLSESQEPLRCYCKPSIRDNFETEMEGRKMFEDDYPVFNQVESCSTSSDSNFEIISPIQLVQMYDFPLALCVDASPTILKGNGSTGDRVIIGCHGGILICVDLSILRSNSKMSNYAIAWKRRFPGRLEASVVLDNESSLFGYVGCHDCNFYKFSAITGEIVCYLSCGSPVRSKGAISEEYELLIVLDSGNCIYCVNFHDLNIIWVRTSYTFLATTNPAIWRNMGYLSTLQNGLVALDLNTGQEIWNSSAMCYYSSPTLVQIRGENITKAGKKKCLVLTGSLTSANTEIIEARNAKTGRVEWVYTSSSTTPYPNVSQPLHNKCCDTIAWVCLSNFRVNNLDPIYGNLKYDLCCGFAHSNEISRCCIINCKCVTNVATVKSECTLFYKIHELNQFMFVNLHDKNKLLLIKPWFMIKDFDTFSAPVYSNEFIMFGGRDNKLHVIRCKHVNKE